VAVAEPGAVAQFSAMVLRAGDQPQLLHNGDFGQDLAGWFPAARQYFVPWHIDSLYLEWLIDQGLVGVALFAAWMAAVLHRLLRGNGRELEAAPFLGAALCAALVVGLVSSVMDVPRVAFLLLLLSLAAWQLTAPCDAGPSRR